MHSSTDTAGLRIHFLGSGSKGNATLVRWGTDCTLLLDCGFGLRELRRRLHQVGIEPEQITALALTHEHTDHVAGFPLFARQSGLPVVLTRGTARALPRERPPRCELVVVRAEQPMRVGPLTLCPFSTSHDAAESVGYRIELPDGRKLGFATDLGELTPEIAAALNGCELLALEANHDLELLRTGPYPWFLKQRIQSSRGHLSNASTARLLSRVASEQLEGLFLLHLSQTNNRPALARQALDTTLGQLDLHPVLGVIAQDEVFSYPPAPPAGQLPLFAE